MAIPVAPFIHGVQLVDTNGNPISHGRYYDSAYRKNFFMAANTSSVTTTVGTATTYVGLCLSNPINSTVNLVPTKLGFGFVVAFAAASVVGLMTGYSAGTNVTHTTPITPLACFIGGSAGTGKVDSSATLPVTPTLSMVLDTGLTGAITTAVDAAPQLVDLEGCFILPPGAFMAFYTSTISGATGASFSIMWEETPV